MAEPGKIIRNPLYCSFCGKRDDEVGYLVAGPTVFICNECVELCREIGQTMLVETGTLPIEETPLGIARAAALRGKP